MTELPTRPNRKAKKVSKAVSDKAKRKSLEKDLDDLWKRYVRANWDNHCAWPGCKVEKPLYCHHYFHKAQGNRARWELFNGIALCYGHHMGQVHRAGNVEPIREVMISWLGKDGFYALRDRVTQVWKPTIYDLEQLRDEFSKILEGGDNMREIKFRAWEKNSKKWYGEDIKWFPLRSLINEDGCSNGLIFSQFTGLHDLTGKEIYEGDILNWNTGAKGIVTWVDEECCFAAEEFDGSPGSWLTGSFEVIGNIYENTELLEE